MIYLTLFCTFARIGLFTLGGGSATIPFLMELPEKYGWITTEQLTTIIAVGESAPGPGGINMASYIGYETAGISGVLCAVAGLCLPSIVIVILIASWLHGFHDRRGVRQFFYGLRPAVVAAIAVAVVGLVRLMLMHSGRFHWPAIVIYVIGLIVTHIPRLKNIPLILWILASGIAGIVFSI
jgi:chromate transporter